MLTYSRALFLSTIFTIVGIVHHFVFMWPKIHPNPLNRKRAIATLVRTLAAVLFPLVLLRFVLTSGDCGKSVLCAPLLWNTCMWYVDSCLVHRSQSAHPGRVASLRLDPASLSGLGFGLCNLLTRTSSEYAHLFIYSIVGCFLVVMPSHNLNTGCWEEQLFDSIQKGILFWCIATLFSAVVLSTKKNELH
jgi:hypothetical protein